MGPILSGVRVGTTTFLRRHHEDEGRTGGGCDLEGDRSVTADAIPSLLTHSAAHRRGEMTGEQWNTKKRDKKERKEQRNNGIWYVQSSSTHVHPFFLCPFHCWSVFLVALFSGRHRVRVSSKEERTMHSHQFVMRAWSQCRRQPNRELVFESRSMF